MLVARTQTKKQRERKTFAGKKKNKGNFETYHEPLSEE